MNTIFEALSDSTRRKILELLAERDMTAGELAAYFDITKPSLSHHLRKLETAGLVTARKNGRFIVYRQNSEAFRIVLEWLYRTAGNVWVR